jgi:FtsP/CotA-like multicopper oxidase with cupredoxin domain
LEFERIEKAQSTAHVSRRGMVRGLISGGTGALLSRLPWRAHAEAALAPQPARGRRPGRVHEHWISADSFLHNLVPSGYDSMMNVNYTSDQTSFIALGYRAYTPHWQRLLPGGAAIGPNTGIPGPTLRAEVGDTIILHFRNNDTYYGFPHSIHPHGVRYTPANDGAWSGLDPHKPGTAVKPGETYTYTYTAGPNSVGAWLYHDHSVPQSIGQAAPDPELGAMLGLFGMIAVTNAETPAVDAEHILFLHDLYAAVVPTLAQDFDCFNGQAFVENTPVFRAKVGQRVRWRVAALGKEFHVFHLHGHTWVRDGRCEDAAVLGPATTLTLDYLEDTPGTWLYHCHVTDHMMGGMMGRYLVL